VTESTISEDVLPGVHAIDLRFMGQPGCIAAYLLKGADGAAALIETGPSSTRAVLLDGLRAAGVDPADVRDILVTHIHLDHSGAVGVLLRDEMPRASVYVHPVGLPHLVDPTRLLRSATRLYGDMMDTLWGEVAPIPPEKVTALEDGQTLRLAGHAVKALFSPGHAAHHVAVRHLDSNAIFTGDVAGVRVPDADVINPPAVPPEFDLEAWERSIDRLLALQPSALLLTHFGRHPDARAHLESLRERLDAWTDLVRESLATGRPPEDLAAELRTRDEGAPGTTAEGMAQLNLIAGYGMSVAGITRYLQKR